jgi:hypothetical protein
MCAAVVVFAWSGTLAGAANLSVDISLEGNARKPSHGITNSKPTGWRMEDGRPKREVLSSFIVDVEASPPVIL